MDRLVVPGPPSLRHRIATVGLTGGIGSGKSTAAKCLVELGAHLVDTDAIARSLTQAGGAAIAPIEAAFGAAALTAQGALDRDAMRRLVFADRSAKDRLEAILHPLIGIEASRQAKVGGSAPVVFDVPLLAESGHWRTRVDRVLVIDCAASTQIERVLRRPGWTEAAARGVVAQQASRAARRAIADAVVDNDGLTIEQFRAELRALWTLWFPPLPPAAD